MGKKRRRRHRGNEHHHVNAVAHNLDAAPPLPATGSPSRERDGVPLGERSASVSEPGEGDSPRAAHAENCPSPHPLPAGHPAADAAGTPTAGRGSERAAHTPFVEIREAQASDIAAIFDFLVRVAPNSGRMRAPLDAEKALREITSVVTDQNYGYALLALVDSSIVGTLGVIYVDWWYAAEKFFADRWFFVDPDPRNGARGPHGGGAVGTPVGRALLFEADAIARAVGAPLVIDVAQKRRARSAVTFVRQHAFGVASSSAVRDATPKEEEPADVLRQPDLH